MTGDLLKEARQRKGLTQIEFAAQLGISQTYLSLFEKGKRRLPDRLVERAVRLLGLPATAMPLTTKLEEVQPAKGESLRKDLASLKYPGYSHMSIEFEKNPTEVLLSALASNSLDARAVEALPWLLLNFPQLNWEELFFAVKIRNLQNRLGFLISLSIGLAVKSGRAELVELLTRRSNELEPSRLANEGLLCREDITDAEKRWIRKQRSADAAHWNILSDLTPDSLRYGQ